MKVRVWLHFETNKEVVIKRQLHWIELMMYPAQARRLKPTCHPSYC